MRTRLGTNQYKKRYQVRARAIILMAPVALTVYALYCAAIFYIKSFRTLKNPGVYLLIITLFFTQVTFAADSKADLSKPIVKEVQQPKPQISIFEQHTQYILSQTHGDIVLRVWNNETSKGQNINMGDKTDLAAYCKAKGMTNEFGFNPYNHQCFKTFEDAVNKVNTWWDNCLKNEGLGECLEAYSGNSKAYISKFLSQSN